MHWLSLHSAAYAMRILIMRRTDEWLERIMCAIIVQVVKGYPQGKMSKHIVGLEPGDTLECKGPIPKLPYKPNLKRSIGMVRIAPLHQANANHARIWEDTPNRFPSFKRCQPVCLAWACKAMLVVYTTLPRTQQGYTQGIDNILIACAQIAGGSGITPMLQVASEIVRNPDDKTQVSLIFGNVSDQDILLKKEIDDMASKHPNFKARPSVSLSHRFSALHAEGLDYIDISCRVSVTAPAYSALSNLDPSQHQRKSYKNKEIGCLQVYYVVDKPSGWFWRGGVGFITMDMLKEHLPLPSPDTLIMVRICHRSDRRMRHKTCNGALMQSM